MEDFFVQECCVHGTDLENHGPTSILCDDPLPIESNEGGSISSSGVGTGGGGCRPGYEYIVETIYQTSYEQQCRWTGQIMEK